MKSLPINAFPIAVSSSKASGFAMAVLFGLALFLNEQNRKQTKAANKQK